MSSFSLIYQLLVEEDIPTSVKESVELEAEDPYRVDVLWIYLKDVEKPGTQESEFDLLFKVTEVIMTIPHLDAGEENIFFTH